MNTTDVTAPIAVVGATGQQGSATVDALLDRQVTVRALTRNVDSGAARALAERGVAVVAADLEAPESIRSAFDGAGAGFAMTTVTGPRGTESEVSHGKAIGDAAQGAQLPFLVYSSVGGADRNTGIPHFESKRRVEEVLMGSVPVNFVRPTFFMENLFGMIARDGDQLLVRMPMPGDVPLQMISVRDIGKVAATLLAQRDPDAAPVEIAGDEVTGERIAELVSHRLGAPATFVQVPLDVLGPNDDVKSMFRWFATPPSYRADFGRTRELVPDAEDLQRWLARQSNLG
ncbi:NmrA/HSCARG family protein [Rhodococcus sp. NPDC059968]|uniref:NmrA/HSCARG family protein n=1 Tax=Rhodococcus sp. NPDC059968 TaxID=3347017 RepID=UPI003670998D